MSGAGGVGIGGPAKLSAANEVLGAYERQDPYQFVSGVREQTAPALAGIESMFQEGLHPRVRQHWKPFRCSQCQPIPGGSMPSKRIDRLNGINAKRLAGAVVLRHGSVA